MAAQVLTQQAVTDALGADVPPREAAERVTFATWAIVTGKSPGGIFNALPTLDDASAEKLAQRLTERVEGTITVEDVKTAPTIEALATVVREHLELRRTNAHGAREEAAALEQRTLHISNGCRPSSTPIVAPQRS